MVRQYRDLEASELFCAKCKRPTPVRKRILLVLPEGDKFDYICTVCGQTVGQKMEQKPGNLKIIIKK
ncbi:MAG TPA: cytoplasmic protein [bacterium]|nr:cytoplasmic protein [bacterium]